MPNYSSTSLMLEQFFQIAAKNKTRHNILRLNAEALAAILPEQCTCFKNVLKQNTTLTYLSLSSAPIPATFIPTLLAALAENTSIIDLEYNPEGLTLETKKQIKSFIRRNRNECLKQEIKPQPVALPEDTPGVLFSWAQKAAEQGDLNRLAALLPKIPNWPQEVNISARSLLHTAAQYGQVACTRYLMSQGARVNFNPNFLGTPSGTALFTAVGHNHYLTTYLLLQAGASTREKAHGFPILHRVRTVELARLLVSYQANPLDLCGNSSFSLSHKNTALHSLLNFQMPNVDLIRYFFRRGLNVNALNGRKETPLFTLAANPYLTPAVFLSTLNLLIHKGVNFDLKNDQEKTVLEVAENMKSTWCCYLAAAKQEMVTLTHAAITLNKLLCKPKTNPFFQFFPPEVRVKIIDAMADYQSLNVKNRENLIVKKLR